MATTKIRSQLPHYFSSSGSSDEGLISHDGIDFLINNDTGKTKMGDKTTYHLSLDHTQKFTGIYTESPAFPLHMVTDSATNAAIVFERTTGAQGLCNATADAATFGSVSNHSVRIITNAITKLTVDTAGNTQIPAAYTTTIGGTNTDLYIDSTGLIGPLPSSEIFKTNIQPLGDGETEWIYQLPVKKCDYIDGTTGIITVIADEAAAIRPEITRYALFEAGGEMIPRANYANINQVIESVSPGIETAVELQRKTTDPNGQEILIAEQKTVQSRPITVNKSDLIYPLLVELGKLKVRIEELEK